MATIRPFHGVRYAPTVVPDLRKVVTPPYDLITKEMQADFYHRHPANVVRLVLNRPEPGEPPGGIYARPAALWQAWRSDGTLVTDPQPALYLYRQTFRAGPGGEPLPPPRLPGRPISRIGVLALVRLEPYARNVILPHERTIAKFVEDRLQLLRATRANFEPIFLLYRGEELRSHIAAAMTGAPEAAVADQDGVEHALWRMTDPDVIAKWQRAFADRTLYIADGHHRYQTALEYAQDHPNGDGPERYCLAALVEMEDPGLEILAFHRVVRHRLVDAAALREQLAPAFEVTILPAAATVEDLLADMARPGEKAPTFGALAGDRRYFLFRYRKDPARFDTEVARLDISILHKEVLEGIVGFDAAAIQQARDLWYLQSAREAARMVEAGEGSCAFFLNPLRSEAVARVADAGEVMPQKSTYFYPKLLSGLVMRALDE